MKTNFINLSLLFALVCAPAAVLPASQPAKTFASPQEAVESLRQAVNTTNRTAFMNIFGSDFERLENPDSVQAKDDLAEFTAALNTTNRLVPESETKMTLEVGDNGWPFPIPLVKAANGWRFDTAAGGEEMINRRIGRNELDVLRVMRVYLQAQREYASRDHDGDRVLEFAQVLVSSPGKTDGLYWPVELNGEVSPLGPLVAYAQIEGYSRKVSDEPQPFHGYFFKIMTRQDKHAPGGKYDYIINGNMIGGFAMVAWPAVYGDSGVMTFIINQEGVVYERDLGPSTGKIVKKMQAYDPDPSWKVSLE